MRRVRSARIGIFLVLSTVSLALSAEALADDQRTGTRLNGRSARPSVLYLNQPNAIDEIRQRIQSGRRAEAVVLARRHVDTVRSTQVVNETLEPVVLYSALNALCVALTTTDQTLEALDVCDEAITVMPREWMAWNSRGTTYFTDSNFDAARNDFLRALALAPKDRDIVETIEANIRLTNQRMMGR